MGDFAIRRTFRLPSLLKKVAFGTLALLVAAGVAIERPLTAPISPKVEIAELTWVEVRTAIEHGFTTVIVPSGGLEQNGPHMRALVCSEHGPVRSWFFSRCAATASAEVYCSTI
jgi:hypothetical protein